MRRVMKIVLAAAVVATRWAPQQARAEGFLNPWAGVVFGNDSAEKKFGSFGVAVGDTGHIVGFEVNFGYAPDLFDEVVDNSELDLMANIMIGPMVGDNGYGVRPFVGGGLGVIRTSFADESEADLGFNAGGGLFINFSPRIGVRGDLRYFRTISDSSVELDFWRAQLGITIR